MSKSATLREPRTLAGPEHVTWPSTVAALAVGSEADHFLEFGKVSPKTAEALLQDIVRPQGHRQEFTLGSKWPAGAKVKMDRGTGRWLDFARHDRSTAPVVTSRVKTLLSSIQPEGLEFLAVKASLPRSAAQVFILNVTLTISCLDVEASVLPTPYRTFPLRQEDPHAFIVQHDRLPTEPCFFRVAEYPEVVLATSAMLERLRPERLSGLTFHPLEAWRASYGFSGT